MKKIFATIVALFPAMALAQVNVNNINSLTGTLTSIGNTVVQILIAFAVIYIIYNVVRYIVKADSDERAPIGKAILWGIVGLFVILSIWGLVAILTNTFRTQNQAPTSQFPQLPPPPPVTSSGY